MKKMRKKTIWTELNNCLLKMKIWKVLNNFHLKMMILRVQNSCGQEKMTLVECSRFLKKMALRVNNSCQMLQTALELSRYVKVESFQQVRYSTLHVYSGILGLYIHYLT